MAFRLLIMGPPGVGKGTFAKLCKRLRLSRDLALPLVVMGDEIRKAVAGKNDPLYSHLNLSVSKGNLINDGLAFAFLMSVLEREKISEGFILDGFPRTVEQVGPRQAEIMQLHKLDFDLCVSLLQDERVILEKVLGRRVCSQCLAVYNLADVVNHGVLLPAIKPVKPGVCDHCQGTLVKRKDDSLRTVKKRLFEFKVRTAPVIERFTLPGKFLSFEVKAGVADYPALLAVVKGMLA